MRVWPALEIAPRDRRPSPAGIPGTLERLQAALTDFDVAAIDDNAPDRWRVFFGTMAERERAAASLSQAFADLTLTPLDVPDEDWAARSQAALQAVRVGDLVVAPPWDVGRYPGALTLVIQPSMGFGTGHHATTRLCLAHLQRLDLRGRTALDVGTGSGVLAIAASRLGATHVLAIDDDPDAIQSARDNIGLNPGAEVTVGVVDVRRAMLRQFDVVVANLTGALLASTAAPLETLTASNGRLILSGFLQEDETAVTAAFSSCSVEERSHEDGWICVTLRRRR